MRVVVGILVGVVMFASGCGDDDEPSGASPPKQCEDLIAIFCRRGIDCLVEGAVIAADQREVELSNCVSEARSALPCARAVGTDPTYPACIEDVRVMSCTPFIAAATMGAQLSLPVNCQGVILIR
jgi:hypothetical protein